MSDHYDGEAFFNPWLPPGSLPRFRDAFRMLLRERRAEWPAWVENSASPDLPASLADDEMALTFVNHATFLVQIGDLTVLTDPVWSERVSPISWIGPKRVRAPGIPFERLPHIDVVVISHNHYDHLDLATLKRLHAAFTPTFIVPRGDRALLESEGFTNVIELDWWESVDTAAGARITFTPTQHQSNRGVFDRQRSLWGSYVIEAAGRRVYFSGDTGYAAHFREIRSRIGTPDVALLGIGAYEPRWFMWSIHMNPAEAVAAHRDLGARQSVAMHFGTFQLSAEGINQPWTEATSAMQAAGVPPDAFIRLAEGETRVYRRTEP